MVHSKIRASRTCACISYLPASHPSHSVRAHVCVVPLHRPRSASWHNHRLSPILQENTHRDTNLQKANLAKAPDQWVHAGMLQRARKDCAGLVHDPSGCVVAMIPASFLHTAAADKRTSAGAAKGVPQGRERRLRVRWGRHVQNGCRRAGRRRPLACHRDDEPVWRRLAGLTAPRPAREAAQEVGNDARCVAFWLHDSKGLILFFYIGRSQRLRLGTHLHQSSTSEMLSFTLVLVQAFSSCIITVSTSSIWSFWCRLFPPTLSPQAPAAYGPAAAAARQRAAAHRHRCNTL